MSGLLGSKPLTFPNRKRSGPGQVGLLDPAMSRLFGPAQHPLTLVVGWEPRSCSASRLLKGGALALCPTIYGGGGQCLIHLAVGCWEVKALLLHPARKRPSGLRAFGIYPACRYLPSTAICGPLFRRRCIIIRGICTEETPFIFALTLPSPIDFVRYDNSNDSRKRFASTRAVS